ncbi:MAG TPA: hypothetical protein VMG08_09655 [Allosphingosinicella sp.]|nr:hypothetical protein [Allosphingosinicella sp.]
MIGTILSFDSETGGVLRGEDGRRYTIAAAAWSGDSPPKAGDRVDFDAEGDMAVAVYALPDDIIAAPGPFLADRPGLPIALLLLIACFLPFLTLGPITANLFNVVSTASSLGRYAPVNVNMETGLWLFHFLYVVPALAVTLILLEWRGLAGRWTRIGIGLVGLLGPVAIALGARALFTATTAPQGRLAARLLRKAREYLAPDLFVPQIGAGWIAIAVLSLALILAGLFWSSPAAAKKS